MARHQGVPENWHPGTGIKQRGVYRRADSASPHEMKLRPSLTDAIEGFYVTLIFDYLHREGILSALGAEEDLPRIAKKRSINLRMLSFLLEYVSLRSVL